MPSFARNNFLKMKLPPTLRSQQTSDWDGKYCFLRGKFVLHGRNIIYCLILKAPEDTLHKAMVACSMGRITLEFGRLTITTNVFNLHPLFAIQICNIVTFKMVKTYLKMHLNWICIKDVYTGEQRTFNYQYLKHEITCSK